jgi:hypothetical protein
MLRRAYSASNAPTTIKEMAGAITFPGAGPPGGRLLIPDPKEEYCGLRYGSNDWLIVGFLDSEQAILGTLQPV